MNLKFHHFFILLKSATTAANLLSTLGMQKSNRRRKHEGQGTVNRNFDFSNGTLELFIFNL